MKTYFGDTGQRSTRLDKSVGGVAQLLDLLVCKWVNPFLWVVNVVLLPPQCRAGDLLGELGVRLQLVVDRRMLARCPDAVWENVSWGIVVLRADSRGVDRLVNKCPWCHVERLVVVRGPNRDTTALAFFFLTPQSMEA